MTSISNYIIKIGLELEFYSAKTINYINDFIEKNFTYFTLIKEVKEEKYSSQYEIITEPTYNLELLITEINNFKKESSQINDFRAKPFLNKAGSALHIHISIHDKLSHLNILNSNSDPKIREFAIGGLCKGINSSMIYFAPLTESYKRFQYYEKFTPRFITWGFESNKTNAIRLTKNTIEHRVPCADSNLKDVLTVILRDIEIGISKAINPPNPNFGEAKYSTHFSNRIALSLSEAKTINDD